jgi:hypothetical protein
MEYWRHVVGYEGWYEVSSLGRVRRVRSGFGAKVGRILRFRPLPSGYLRVTLSKDCVEVDQYVHVLVAAAFLGPCPDGHEVNHKNGEKGDNRWTPEHTNLEYVTHAKNNEHARRTGLWDPARGEAAGKAKLTEEQVRAIRTAYAAGGVSHRKLAAEYAVSHATIRGIITREYWAHVP